MFVSFFFDLPGKKRPLQTYAQAFEKVLQLVESQHETLTFFSNNDTLLDIAKAFKCCNVEIVSPDTFWAWTQRDAIAAAMRSRKGRFGTSEFEDFSYVAIQLCKFEAVARVSLQVFDEPVVWIDAGLRASALVPAFNLNWAHDGKVHVVQSGQLPVCESWIFELPGSHIMGGCFGGFPHAMQRLHAQTTQLLKQFWSQSISLNDQQVLSVLQRRNPTEFHCQRAFRQWIPCISGPQWHNVLQILEDPNKETFQDFRLSVFVALCVCVLLWNFK